ncbi:MAG: tRNA 2-selenouridine(34) synthase MnmH [Bacteroidales bacterium]|nr:tRNA 2-selenouridine(34) synthase MnmH [Bacteroidales bacterium]
MVEKIEISEFLKRGKQSPIIDVRSPAEFKKGHIPGATNLPLFENKEREIVGILYKNKSRQDAIRKGLEIVGPKMTAMVDQAILLADKGEILIHCWRGGMRSASVAWLFESVGLQVYLLEGGYKQYRSFIRETMFQNRKLLVLGGLTGSGKTILIKALMAAGEPAIDLEGLANHRGSAFGGVGLGNQPSTEYFENLLHEQMEKLPADSIVWVEDESRRIGELFQPEYFHNILRTSPVAFVKISDVERRKILVEEYGNQPHDELIESVKLLTKRAGGLISKQALLALDERDYGKVVDLLLPYYDKQYFFGIKQRSNTSIHEINLAELSDSAKIIALTQLKQKIAVRKY